MDLKLNNNEQILKTTGSDINLLFMSEPQSERLEVPVLNGNARTSGSSIRDSSIRNSSIRDSSIRDSSIRDSSIRRSSTGSSATSDSEDLETGGVGGTAISIINNIEKLNVDSENNTGVSGILMRIRLQIKHKKILYPTSKIRRIWLRILGIFIIWNIFSIPSRISYSKENGFIDNDFDHPVFYLFDYLGDICFWLNILLHHYSYFFHYGVLSKEPKEIRNHYRKFWFWMDVITVFPIDLFIWTSPMNHAFARLPRFLGIFRLTSYFRIWESYSSFPNIYRIIKVFLSFSILSHWTASLFYSIAVVEGFPKYIENNWFLFSPEQLSPMHGKEGNIVGFSEVYSRCLYWAIAMMTGQGADPQTPQTILEIWFTIYCVFVGLIIFATAIGEIWNLIKTMNEASEIINRKKDRMNSLMQHRKLPQSLKKRVWNHFEYLQSAQLGFQEDENVLQGLPYHLRSDIYLYLNRKIITNVPLFNRCPAGCIKTLSMKLRPIFFNPGDNIVICGEVGHEMYFIANGEVEALTASGESIRKMGSGDFFGEVAIMSTNSRRTASIVAVTHVIAYYLTSSDFKTVMADYPEVQRRIGKVGDKRRRNIVKKRIVPKIAISNGFELNIKK